MVELISKPSVLALLHDSEVMQLVDVKGRKLLDELIRNLPSITVDVNELIDKEVTLK